jgi:hypothetical protein
MVDELRFTDNQDKWQLWKQNKPAYNAWFEKMSGVSAAPPPKAARATDAAPASGGDE